MRNYSAAGASASEALASPAFSALVMSTFFFAAAALAGLGEVAFADLRSALRGLISSSTKVISAIWALSPWRFSETFRMRV